MILSNNITINFYNIISSLDDSINIKYPDVDYNYWIRTNNCKDDNEICSVLDTILNHLDCTVIYDCGRPMMTTYPMYDIKLSEYYYYLIKINNQLIYNIYLDKLITRHMDNIIFEYYNPVVEIKKVSSRKTKKKLPPNVFVRHITKDLFSGEDKYIYENLRTKQKVESSNPNLLEQLNAKPTKHTKVKKTKVVNFKFKFN